MIHPTILVSLWSLLGTPLAEPGGARSVRLETFPDRVRIDDRYGYAQLVVLAHRADGQVIDVTRAAEIRELPASLALDERRLARPVADGAGELRLAWEGVEALVPVEVSGQGGDRRAPSFLQDVEPRLSRFGCNLGTCHGADKGKNGFKLSLRGYDAAFDHAALTDDLSGRRFDRVAPEESLFLLKPTGRVPHAGGQRTEVGSRDYELLRDWVESGALLDLDAPRVTGIRIVPDRPTIPEPGDGQQFAVLARYADGTERDVSAHAFYESSDIEVATVDERGLLCALRRGETALLARFEGRYAATRAVVMGDREGWEWPAVEPQNWIDELVFEKLRQVRTTPADVCSDEEFLRRAHLDLVGLPPTPREVRTFLLDRRRSREKREELIDRLIGSAGFVEHWTNKWCDLLQVNPKFLGKRGAESLRTWVRASVASNQPYDEFVREVLTAGGSTLENPPAAYFRVLREPDVAMENTTQLFLGVRFNCNKCHDHPFERWTQDQHWELSAFFADVERSPVEGSMDEERITDGTGGTVTNPRTGKPAAARFPYEHAGDVPVDAPRRARLAAWLTAEENPYFARSYVNRLWSYFLGVGLIEPVDDIRASNPPSNPALLDRLTAEFVAGGFDARELMRTILRSRTYQQSIATDRWNADDGINFSHALPRRLPAEVLFDALHQATGSRPRLPGQRAGTHAMELADPSVEPRDGFLALFGRPARESACECERASGVSLGQALSLVNGPTVADAIHDPRNALTDLVEAERDPSRLVEELYLSFLCRFPSADESRDLAPSLDGADPANLPALAPLEEKRFEERAAAWLAANVLPEWTVPRVLSARSSAGATLSAQPDGSLLAGGAPVERDTTTLVLWTSAERLSGLRLEALPDPSLPGHGPGRAENGNFVLGSVAVVLVPAGGPEQGGALAFAGATADFTQEGFDPSGTLDENPSTGWAVMPAFGARHEAVLHLAEPRETPGGATLIVTLEQPYGGRHTLGRFRLSVTSTPAPRASSLPEDVQAALRTAPEARTAEQSERLRRAYLATDADMRSTIRLAATHDLAWALVNSPAFLFNR